MTPRPLQRYEWNDAAIYACKGGHLSKGARDVILLLSPAVNWRPTAPERDGVPGLYWRNEDACQSVGLGWSTFRRHRGEIEAAGFWTHDGGGNLIPTVPAQIEQGSAQIEHGSAQIEQRVAQIEQVAAQIEPPCSEDLLTEDLPTEDLLTVHSPAPEKDGGHACTVWCEAQGYCA